MFGGIVRNLLLGPSKLYFANFLGYINVFADGVPWSFSQQGNFTSATWDVVGESIDTVGPGGVVGKLVKRSLPIHGRMVITTGVLQSNDQGVDTANPPAVMQQAPLPGQLMADPGGFSPNPDGILSNAVDTFANTPANDHCYKGPLVPGHENINTGRTPGRTVNNTTWLGAAGQVIAAALPADSVHVPKNWGIGTTNFQDTVQRSVAWTSVSWAGSTGTIVFPAFHNSVVNDPIWFSSQGGWPAQATITGVTGVYPNPQTVTIHVAANPGAFPAAGIVFVLAPQTTNQRDDLIYSATVVAPSMGLRTLYLAWCGNGNEANSDFQGVWATAQLAVVRTIVTYFASICGNDPVTEIPIIGWPQVEYNNDKWNSPPTLYNCASQIALGALAASLDPANRVISWSQYGALHCEPGRMPNLHFTGANYTGHWINGQNLGNKIIDLWTGEFDPTPAAFNTGEGVLTRVANSLVVTTTFPADVEIDTATVVTDPGDSGFVVSSGAANALQAGVNGSSQEDIATVAITGSRNLAVTLGAPPAHSWGNVLGAADNVGNVYGMPNSTAITTAVYDAGTGNATLTTKVPHGKAQGQQTNIIAMFPHGYNAIPATLLAGTGGSTLVYHLAAPPGTVTLTNAVWADTLGGQCALTIDTAITDITNGAWITIDNSVLPAGLRGTWQVYSSTDSTHLVVTMLTDPTAFVSGGPVTGGGNLADNGSFDVGADAGPRTTLRKSAVVHYDNATGAPLYDWIPKQRATIDVYASTKSVVGMLDELVA